MSHRRSKNNVLVDCIKAVKAVKEANLARKANEAAAGGGGADGAGSGEFADAIAFVFCSGPRHHRMVGAPSNQP